MSPAERATYNLGVKATIDAARIVAITIETAEDAGTFRKKVAAETLAAFAENAKSLMLEASLPVTHCLNADQNNAPLLAGVG